MSDTPRTDAPLSETSEDWPRPQYAQEISFEGRGCVVMAPEEYEALFNYAQKLECDLASTRAERDGWKSLSVTVIAADNPSVNEYIASLEKRAEGGE